MEQRTLGATGLRVSVLGVGSWQLGGPLELDGRPDGFPDPGADAAVRLIRAAGDLGINLVDTAPIYGDGEAERRVGRALRPDRERWVVCTKFGPSRGPRGERRVDVRPEAIRPSLEASLRRLGTDRVEILLYHAPPDPAELEGGRLELERLREEGKLRAFGISCGDPAPARRLVEAGALGVLMAPRSLHTERSELFALARAAGSGVIVRGAFERGRLVSPAVAHPPDDARSTAAARLGPEALAGYAALRPPGLTPTAFALRYLLDAPEVHCVLLGARSLDQLERARAALSAAPLGPRVRAAVVRRRRRLREGSPLRRVARRLRAGLRRSAP